MRYASWLMKIAIVETMAPDMNSSMHHDLAGGKPLELPWLSRGVVELGRKVGVPTPASCAVCDILALHTAGRTTRSTT